MSTKTDRHPEERRKRTWYVTAKHGRVNRSVTDAYVVPFGPAHLREAGGADTACGLPALNWPIFWDVTPSPGLEMCIACRHVSQVGQGPVNP